MPQRQEPRDPHTPVATPAGQKLSEQERQDLDTAARGIDRAVSGLPDDGPPPVPPKDAAHGGDAGAQPGERADESKTGQKPRADAQTKGLVPGADENTPPLDGQAPARR